MSFANKGGLQWLDIRQQVKLISSGLIVLLDDAIAIIEASDDPDCRAWLTQAHATLDQVRL
jgi:hypothetical protein